LIDFLCNYFTRCMHTRPIIVIFNFALRCLFCLLILCIFACVTRGYVWDLDALVSFATNILSVFFPLLLDVLVEKHWDHLFVLPIASMAVTTSVFLRMNCVTCQLVCHISVNIHFTNELSSAVIDLTIIDSLIRIN